MVYLPLSMANLIPRKGHTPVLFSSAHIKQLADTISARKLTCTVQCPYKYQHSMIML